MTFGDKIIRIGCASAFWGDTETAAPQLVHGADLDYLVFDYLSEITMSIMAGARIKNPDMGYAPDFVSQVMGPLVRDIAEKGIRVVSNAGGVNPLACRDKIKEIMKAAGIDMKIGVVLGDDLQPFNGRLKEQCVLEMNTGEPLPEATVSMNAYLGAVPIARCLEGGAQVVITGRIVDSALALGPLMHEFGWAPDDYDRLAAGSLAGHIIECGTQCTGGNFTDWETVGGYENVGFPIAECGRDGVFTVTKPAGTGGMVSPQTVAEQLVYEIGDPRAYVLPDVICDFSRVKLRQTGKDRVEVKGATGRPPTDTHKVSATYPDGYRCTSAVMLAGLDAERKAERVADAVLRKALKLFDRRGLGPFTETSVDILGAESTYGHHARSRHTREVVLKIAVRHRRKEALRLFSREIAQAATAMAPGLTGMLGGRPKVSPVIRLFSFLVPKSSVPIFVDLEGETMPVEIPPGEMSGPWVPPPEVSLSPPSSVEHTASVPLVMLALARSGDKGNHCNIGVISRDPAYVPYIRRALTEEAVAAYMKHVLDAGTGKVTRWELPGINAFNFLLENSLGGGGMASLRTDAQGKAFAQQLLEFPVEVPEALASSLRNA